MSRNETRRVGSANCARCSSGRSRGHVCAFARHRPLFAVLPAQPLHALPPPLAFSPAYSRKACRASLSRRAFLAASANRCSTLFVEVISHLTRWRVIPSAILAPNAHAVGPQKQSRSLSPRRGTSNQCASPVRPWSKRNGSCAVALDGAQIVRRRLAATAVRDDIERDLLPL